MPRPYVVTEAPTSHCPTCHQSVVLLATVAGTGPAFYLCDGCGFIGQVGVGPIRPGRPSLKERT
jgi:hypothetical protein